MFEEMSVPTAPINTVSFAELVKNVASNVGMPNMRFSFTPHPIAGMPISISREYLQGEDPITSQPLLVEIVEALTKPLSEDDTKTGIVEVTQNRLLASDTLENLEFQFNINHWTDFMTITLPTEERVAEILKGTSHTPNERVGRMQASPPHPMYSYTVENVATCAVMAGAKPEHLPVILAIASTGVTSLYTSTTSFSRMVVANGPIRNELNMNAGIGALGPFNYTNAVIGRAWTILSRCLSGSGVPGTNYMGSLGNNLNYNNLCFPEKEESLPEGWDPLHVQKGFRPEESIVSVFTGYSIRFADTSFTRTLHTQIPYYLKFTNPAAGACMIMDPTVAQKLKREGFNTKEELIQYAWENTKIKVEDYWNYYQLVDIFIRPRAEKGVEPYASWLKLPEGSLIPHIMVPDRICIIVVGGETQEFWQLADHYYIASASVDAWR
jgi:hypothetical protein